ncbi:Predicted arabinose efflux permease, MFS family [Paenibacillus sp. yr247]|nr:Predicted arabinose efflux permease, MFS family [Paenibacillus sp. yr247]
MKPAIMRKWYYGWNIVIVTSLITMLTVGTRLGAGPFFNPMLDSLGISRTLLSSIFAVSMIVYGIGMPIAGYLVDKLGTRFVLLSGAVMIAISTVWAVCSNDPVSFTFAYSILLSLGLSFTSPIAVTPIVSKWFTRQWGKALFYLSTGSMGGIAIMTPIFTFAIEWVGWKTTMLLLAGLFLVLIAASTLILSDDAPVNTDLLPGQIMMNRTDLSAPMISLDKWTDALATRPFWHITFGLFACGFSMNLLGSHGVPMLMDHGFHEHTSSFSIGLLGLVAMISSVFLGNLSDNISKRLMLSSIYIFRGAEFLLIVLIMSEWQLYMVSAFGGLVWAGSTALSSAILGTMYGLRWLGILYGWSYFIHQIGGAVGVYTAGWGYEFFGTHLFAFGTAAGLSALAGLVCLRLPAYNKISVSKGEEV